MSEARIVLTTVGDKQHADTLAEQLLERRLAACVNIVGPVRSIYRWQGQIERADEYLLILKTTADCAAKLPSILKNLHPYDLPECIEVAIPSGSQEYLDWVASSVGNA